ncbi:MAG: hypothetical protein ACQEWM_12765 [Actinomycetota bacterium]
MLVLRRRCRGRQTASRVALVPLLEREPIGASRLLALADGLRDEP